GNGLVPAWIVIEVDLFTPLDPPPPDRILTTDEPAPGIQGPADWAAALASRQEYLENDPPPVEWMPVLDPDNELGIHLTTVSGWMVHSDESGEDVPFTHPFGVDFEFYLAPDDQYRHVLAQMNLESNLPSPNERPVPGLPDPAKEYRDSMDLARRWGLMKTGIF